MSRILLFILILSSVYACKSQTEEKVNSKDKVVGGHCEGCEAVYEYGNKTLTPQDTIPGFSENEPKLKVTGVIYHNDEKTPAQDVILYVYHTNTQGIYPPVENATGWARRHGKHRGWIKTDESGSYTFYTFRPASYPNTVAPQHIHAIIKEPGYSDYYISDYFFDDDPNLTSSQRREFGNRGGYGVVQPVMKNGMLTVERDIILGKNVPNYE